jgi:hypothetical protein
LLTTAGLQVPEIPFVEVVGKTGAVVPVQNAGTVLNVGVTLGFTVTFKVVVVAHWPAVGVKVYVPLAVLLTIAGLHVPVIPLVDVVGKTGAVAPLQNVGIAANVGVTLVVIVTLIVVLVAHCPAVGVKVYTVVPRAAVDIVAGLHVPEIPFVDVADKLAGVAPTQ